MSEAVIRLQLERLPEGGWLATSPDVPGLIAQGRTLSETIEIAQDVARKIAESYIEHGDPLPEALRAGVPDRFEIQVPVGVE